MSGGSTGDAHALASCRRAASLSVLSTPRLMQAARNASGWFAFIQAVWYATSA